MANKENPMDVELDPVVEEAQRRFRRCEDWESEARAHFDADLKFAEADSENGYQWPNDLRRQRDIDERPCLTINKTRQHNLQIINDAKQNKPGISVRPIGDGANYDAARIMAGVVRHIESQSNATLAYDLATEFQVKAGIGYWRVITDYAGPETFDQEIFIRSVPDPMMVYLDPDIKERDGSDARFGFIFTDLDVEEFLDQYPEYKDAIPEATIDATAASWANGEKVRVCEYFRKIESKDILVSFVVEGQRQQVLKSQLPKAVWEELEEQPDTMTREVSKPQIEWHFIVGMEVKETQVWPGKYIPIIRVVGEETVIDGRLDRKGHTRSMKDPQRMYNYWSSSAVEHVALQGKTPWVAPAEAIEGYETYWESANRVNHAVLPYNGVKDDGSPIAPPQRAQPPVMATAYLQGMQVAASEMMMASGQFETQMGEKGNERSGVAINARQRKGDNATYHYVDNLALAVRFTGVVLLDLIPKIYDTRRVLQILGEDGTNIEVTIDPEAKQVLTQRAGLDGQIMERVFNPGLGKYMVQADIGPAYGTKREQAFDAFVTLITQAPQLTGAIGDIMLRAADFPMADEAAERLKRAIPAHILGKGPAPELQQAQAQIAQLQALLDATSQQLAEAQISLKGKDQKRDIDAYNAETKRMDVLAGAIDPSVLAPLVQQLVQEALQTSALGHIFASNQGGSAEAEARQAKDTAETPGTEGIRRGSDGFDYAPHPQMPGKWLKLGQSEGGM